MGVATVVITRNISDYDGSIIQFQWSLTTANPIGTAIQFPEWADRTVTFDGTSGLGNWGGAVAVLEGGPDDSKWFTLKDASDPASGVISTSAADIQAVVFDLPRYMRPNLTTPGTAAVVEVYMLLRRAHRLRA